MNNYEAREIARQTLIEDAFRPLPLHALERIMRALAEEHVLLDGRISDGKRFSPLAHSLEVDLLHFLRTLPENKQCQFVEDYWSYLGHNFLVNPAVTFTTSESKDGHQTIYFADELCCTTIGQLEETIKALIVAKQDS